MPWVSDHTCRATIWGGGRRGAWLWSHAASATRRSRADAQDAGQLGDGEPWHSALGDHGQGGLDQRFAQVAVVVAVARFALGVLLLHKVLIKDAAYIPIGFTVAC